MTFAKNTEYPKMHPLASSFTSDCLISRLSLYTLVLNCFGILEFAPSLNASKHFPIHRNTLQKYVWRSVHNVTSCDTNHPKVLAMQQIKSNSSPMLNGGSSAFQILNTDQGKASQTLIQTH